MTCHGIERACRVPGRIGPYDELLEPSELSNKDLPPLNSEYEAKDTLTKENDAAKEGGKLPCHEDAPANSKEKPMKVNSNGFGP